MKKNCLVVTNNSKVNRLYKIRFGEQLRLNYLEGQDYLAVLEKVRDYVHQGYKLLTHPLSGSLKPNQTPCKSVLLALEDGGINFNDLQIIENSLASYHKFQNCRTTPCWTPQVREDFETVDMSILDSAINHTMVQSR